MLKFDMSHLPSHVNNFLVMDFDGVFNVDYPMGTFPKEFYNADKYFLVSNPDYNECEFKKERGPKNFRICYSEDLINDFNELLAKDNTMLLWLTTWKQGMKKLIDPLKLTSVNPMYYLDWDNTSYDQSLKLDAMNDFLNIVDNGQRKTVWADDVVLSKDFSLYLDDLNIKDNPRVMTFLPFSQVWIVKV